MDELPTSPDLTVVVVNYNTAHLLARMFADLRTAAGALRLQCIVVDNASRDDSVTVLRQQHPDVELICSETNLGFGRANNLAIPRIRAETVLLLNTDAFVSEDTLRLSLDHLRHHERVGILGVRLVGRDGVDQPSCRFFPTPLNLFLNRAGLARWVPGVRAVDPPGLDRAAIQVCDWVPGCYYLTRRRVIETCGLFDPRYFLYYEEVDHCRRVQAAGWSVCYFPLTSVIHLGGESAKSDGPLTASGRQLSHLLAESEVLYVRKHHGLAGLCAHVLLSLTGTAWNSLKLGVKAVLGRVPGLTIIEPWADLALLMRSVAGTQGGRRPTR